MRGRLQPLARLLDDSDGLIWIKAREPERWQLSTMLTSVTVNRAPVLTLRAAIVAERLGFAWDLGRALAGLNAYSKGMSLALFQPSPEMVRERRKKVHHGHRLRIDLLHRAPPERPSLGGR